MAKKKNGQNQAFDHAAANIVMHKNSNDDYFLIIIIIKAMIN